MRIEGQIIECIVALPLLLSCDCVHCVQALGDVLLEMQSRQEHLRLQRDGLAHISAGTQERFPDGDREVVAGAGWAQDLRALGHTYQSAYLQQQLR